jgi:hypothetical protein
VSTDDPDSDDREHADDRRPGDPAFPSTVMTAAVIWIGVGVLGLLTLIATLIVIGGHPGRAPIPCCGSLIATAFLLPGYQTVTGAARDTFGNGVGSLLLGLLQLLFAAVLGIRGLEAADRDPRVPIEAVIVTSLVIGVIGVMLVAAGILAFAGRERYLEWRRAAAASWSRRLDD